jgi:hypothetical protein
MSGVGELEQGLAIEFNPFSIGRVKDEFARSPRAGQRRAGFHLEDHAAPQLVAAFTADTDFAEAEVDARQINITRFPLLFPGKRAFFLQGANKYVFGHWVSDSRSFLFSAARSDC